MKLAVASAATEEDRRGRSEPAPADYILAMKIEQLSYVPSMGWTTRSGCLNGRRAQLVFVFGGRYLLEAAAGLDELRRRYDGARLVIASTAGEIIGTEVTEDTIVATAVSFDSTRVRCAATRVGDAGASHAAGCELARELAAPDLVHVFALSDGGLVNGTELARGFNEHLPAGAMLTGGLAGDGARFERTVVGLDETPSPGRIVAVGFYGESLRVTFGSAGGWVPFGPAREVTGARGNTLFALDDQSALRLYKKYLGDQANELPGAALRFPLCVTSAGSDQTVVRTILSIDETAESMTFAGDIPVGARVRFMRASYEDLIDGAASAAERARGDRDPDLVICVSCVGRRIVLGQRAEEESENVRTVVGERAVLTGFYSYGELAPSSTSAACQLHNQTMTITTMCEL
jgi:hypothetical protein